MYPSTFLILRFLVCTRQYNDHKIQNSSLTSPWQMAKSHGQQTISFDFWLLRVHEGCHLCAPFVVQHLSTKNSGYVSHTATGHNTVTVETCAALQKEHKENIRRYTSSLGCDNVMIRNKLLKFHSSTYLYLPIY
jgi:hypothetical protein